MKKTNGPRDGHGIHTRAVHDGHPADGAMSTPIVHSATFAFTSLDAMKAERERHEAGSFYQRHGHPTVHACERRLAMLEDAESALLFASGMAAITAALLAHVNAGEHVVVLRECYGGTLGALRWGSNRFGWTHAEVDPRDPASWEAAFRPRTRIFHVESPTNPTLAVVDLAKAAEIAHRHGALLTVDNTVASPVGQHPLALGADLVAYSATKSIGGHSDLLSGAVLGSKELLDPIWHARHVFGPTADPSTAWLIERSLKTLPLRVERGNANALELAQRLSSHPRVNKVLYPGLDDHPGHEIARRQMTLGFGPLLSFDVRGGAMAAQNVVEAFGLIHHAASLGSVQSLASLPAHTSHTQLSPAEREAAGIPAGLIRLSVGIEDVEDLWADCEHALSRVE